MILIIDINGKEIKEGDLFEFNYLVDLDNRIKLKGMFTFDVDYLCYDIDVIENEYYTSLNYLYNFALISNIKKI